MFNPKKLKVTVTLTEEMLGMAPASAEVYSDFIASKAPDAATAEEEVQIFGVDSVVEKGTTVFPRDEDGDPFIWDYQIRGFFKDTCSALRRAPGTESSKVKAFKKVIDGNIFVSPRRIKIHLQEGSEVGICQRALRASTAQGERTALASSESVPEGSSFEFEVELFDPSMESAVREWFDFAQYRGFGQWRNSGKGRATCVVEKV